MQKKLIALAVAGLASTAAFAQSNVTIYGIVDAGYVYSSGDRANGLGSANRSGIESGIMAGSRIGFKGEEALGNGLKAVFTLEYSLATDTNTGIGNTGGLNTRQAFVGLNSAKLGQVALGRQYAPGYAARARTDALFSSGIASPVELLSAAAGNTIVAASAARWNNSITYTSPSWSGFTVSGIYAYAENATSTTASNGVSTGNNGMYGAGLNYANGPLNLDLVYHARNDITTPVLVGNSAATQDGVNEWFLGGSYDFKIVKLFATYQDQTDKNGTSNQEASNKVWQVGATVPVFGNGKIHASYSQLKADNSSGAIGNGDADAWAIGYSHALSKRTTLYTTYTAVDNDSDARIAAGTYSDIRVAGEKNATFTAGINHTF